MKLYFDSLTTLKVIHAESPIVIFFGTYGMPSNSSPVGDGDVYMSHDQIFRDYKYQIVQYIIYISCD